MDLIPGRNQRDVLRIVHVEFVRDAPSEREARIRLAVLDVVRGSDGRKGAVDYRGVGHGAMLPRSAHGTVNGGTRCARLSRARRRGTALANRFGMSKTILVSLLLAVAACSDGPFTPDASPDAMPLPSCADIGCGSAGIGVCTHDGVCQCMQADGSDVECQRATNGFGDAGSDR